jgi:hypothetical protein
MRGTSYRMENRKTIFNNKEGEVKSRWVKRDRKSGICAGETKIRVSE